MSGQFVLIVLIDICEFSLHANIHDSTRQESRDVGSLERVGKSAVWEVLRQNSTAKIQLFVNI